MTESRLNVNVLGIGGSRTPADPSTVRDSITFGHPGEPAGIRNSSVDVNVALGQGNTNLAFTYGVDLGDFTDVAGPAGFGRSTMNVNLTGSDRRQDVDNVTLLANGAVDTGSTLNFDADLGAGNDSFAALIDAANFRIANGAGGTAGGAAHIDVKAGSGDDAISFRNFNRSRALELSGLLDVNILGGSGKDNIKVDLGGAGFTDGAAAARAATNRDFRFRLLGGSGDMTAKVNLANSPTATFNYDVAILGGSGANDITFIGTNPVGGTPTFRPVGSVLIDTDSGTSNTVDVFGNFPVNSTASAQSGPTTAGRVDPAPADPPASSAAPPSATSNDVAAAPPSQLPSTSGAPSGMSSPTSASVQSVRRGAHPLGHHRMTPAARIRPLHRPGPGTHRGHAHRPGR
jgi:hypothetical protein